MKNKFLKYIVRFSAVRFSGLLRRFKSITPIFLGYIGSLTEVNIMPSLSLGQVLRAVFLAGSVATLFGCVDDGGGGAPKAVSVKIIHTNDHHSYLDSSSYDLMIDNVATRVDMGGFARLSTIINKERNDHSIVVNSGELNGTLYFSLFKGEPDFKIFNELKLDGYTLGNHEFDEGDARLAELIGMANFPILSANMSPEPKSPLYAVKDKIKPYVIKEIDGEKIGIFGILKVEKTKNSSLVSDNVTFADEIKTAKKIVAELEAKGVNKIVLVSHVGYYNDILFAQQVPGLDVIVGGDTHSLLGDTAQLAQIGLAPIYANDQTGPFTGYSHDSIAKMDGLGKYPTTVKGPNGDPVYVVTAWSYAYALGVLNVDFDADGKVKKAGGNIIIPVGDKFQRKNAAGAFVQVAEDVKTQIMTAINASPILTVAGLDSTIDALLAPYRVKLEQAKNEVVGSITQTMANTRIPTPFSPGQTPTGSYAGQVVAEAFRKTNPAIDVAIQNVGGVRANLLAGPITMAQVIEVLPFSNTIVMIKMKGSDIVKVLNEGAYYSLHSGSTGAFPAAAGLRYDVFLSGGEYGVIKNVEVQDRKTGTWSAIANDTLYTVATNSFTAQGKDNYLSFKSVRDADPTVFEDTYILYYVPLVNYIKSLPNKQLPALDLTTYSLKSVTP